MFNYFKGKGLNDLLWVVSSYPTGQHKDYLAGPQYVDILGFDWAVDWRTFDRVGVDFFPFRRRLTSHYPGPMTFT